MYHNALIIGQHPEDNICGIFDQERHILLTCFFSILIMSIFIILRSSWIANLFYKNCFEHSPTHFLHITKASVLSIYARAFYLLLKYVVFWKHRMWLNISNQECVWLVGNITYRLITVRVARLLTNLNLPNVNKNSAFVCQNGQVCQWNVFTIIF